MPGETVIGGAVTVNVAVVSVPPLATTITVLGPITALAGTFRLVLQLPQTSTWTISVFQDAPLKVMPPAGIVSSGTKPELLIVTRILKVPVLGESVIGGILTVKVAADTVPPFVVTITLLAPTAASVGTLKLVDQAPESLTTISPSFQTLPPNVILPTGILS
jgi:hypothetical protein